MTEKTVMEPEVTACIPVYNGIRTIGYTLFALEHRAQCEPVKVIICDNGSRDGSHLLIRGMQKDPVSMSFWNGRHPAGLIATSVDYNDSLQGRFPREGWNIRQCFKKMWPLVDTEFILMVDADVDTPRGAVRSMLDILKNDPTVGMVGCQYDPVTDHVKHGCALIRTLLALEILPTLRTEVCMCRQINQFLKVKKMKAVAIDGLKARHASREI